MFVSHTVIYSCLWIFSEHTFVVYPRLFARLCTSFHRNLYMAQPSSIITTIDLYVMIIGGTIMFFMMATGSAVLIILYQRRKLKHCNQIHETEIKSQHEQFYGIIEAIELESKRMAHVLHNDVGGSLSAIRLFVNDSTSNAAENRIHFRQLIDAAIENVRRISNDLLPQGLEEFGLAFAIESLCDNTMDEYEINIELNICDTTHLGNCKNVTVYRLLQELLNNTLKQAKATSIQLKIWKENGTLKIIYLDNDKSFGFAEALQNSSRDTNNIEARVRMLNGKISFETSLRLGSTVEMEIPIK